MRLKKDEVNKKKTISITIDNELNKILEDKTNNKSMFISWLIIEKLNEIGIDTSKIKM